MALFKKTAAALAAVILALTFAFGPVSAAGQSGLSVGFSYIEPGAAGGGFTLTLTSVPQVQQGHYLTCVRFKLRYDPSAFTVTTGQGYSVVPSGTGFPAAIEDQLIVIPSGEQGVVEFCYIDWTTVESILNGSGVKRTLFASGQSVTVPFTLTPGADLSVAHVFEVYDVRYGLDADIQQSQLIAGTGARVTLDGKPAYARGDVDRDGRIDSDDAVYLLRHVLFPSEYVIENETASADVTRDGKVDSDDAVYLLRHVLFPSEYPLN